jgi:DNA-binding XRE family transcriptional regulator
MGSVHRTSGDTSGSVRTLHAADMSRDHHHNPDPRHLPPYDTNWRRLRLGHPPRTRLRPGHVVAHPRQPGPPPQPPDPNHTVVVGRELEPSQLHLGDLRRALGVSQQEMAEALRCTQGRISQLEAQDDALVSTVWRYVTQLGGVLAVTASFGSTTHDLYGVRVRVRGREQVPSEHDRRVRVTDHTVRAVPLHRA